MDRPTVDTYDRQGVEWAAAHSTPKQPGRARAFDDLVPPGAPRLDAGCGAGRYTDLIGEPVIGLDASTTMLDACRSRVPRSIVVRGDLEALPFARGSLAGGWSWMAHHHLPRVRLPMALWDIHRVLAVGAPFDLQVMTGDHEGTGLEGDRLVNRYFATWERQALIDAVTGAGFDVDEGSVEVEGDELRLRAIRARTLADTVGPDMRVLVCGLNPSLYAADAGVGFARPGNRFWPAALAAGLVTGRLDPVGALRVDRVGMTDQVKRATRSADQLTAGEYRSGLERLARLVTWLRPGVVCFVGLAGWRAASGRAAKAGLQDEPLGGRPVYVMPSTSGLNARCSVADLTDHLRNALVVADADP